MPDTIVRVLRLRESAVLPTYATDGSVGGDLYADIDQPVEIGPGETVRIPTGLAMEIPAGFGGFIFARSSMGIKHGVVPANCIGVIDTDYRGEVVVFLINHSQKPYTIAPRDRVAQLVVLPCGQPMFAEADELSETGRAQGGFGSTGK